MTVPLTDMDVIPRGRLYIVSFDSRLVICSRRQKYSTDRGEGTFGPMASMFNVCAISTDWRIVVNLASGKSSITRADPNYD